MKKPTKVEKSQCSHCRIGRERKQHHGVYYHTYKESNGLDYDRYTSLCTVQTEHGIELLRAKALSELDKKLQQAKEEVASLKYQIKEARKAKSVGTFRSYWEHN